MTRNARQLLKEKDVVDGLLSGMSVAEVAEALNGQVKTVRRVAHRAGLSCYPPNQWGRWMWEYEVPTMSTEQNGEWNLSPANYEALLTSEREQGGNEQVAVQVEEPNGPLLLSDDPDLAAAARLLDKAADQRRTDVAFIADLESRLADLTLRLGSAVLSAQNEYEKYDQRIAYLETENNRLSEEIKREISRGFLRQSMDGLRSALG